MARTPSTTRRDALVGFRQAFYGCLSAWKDALFELCDAILCAQGPVGSIPSLSLESEFTRSHGSLYKALAGGGVDQDALRGLLVAARPVDWPLIFAVDASAWARSDAETSPGRGFYHSASRHSAGQPIVAGWSYQWVSQVSFANDSWTAPLDVMRLIPGEEATTATVGQLTRLLELLPKDGDVPLFVFDAGYDPIALGHELNGERVEVCCRIRDDRVFYDDPPAKANRPASSGGRPPRHGTRSKCSDQESWSTPDDSASMHDERYGTVNISAWHHLHPRLSGRGHWAQHATPPIVKGSVIRVDVEHLPKSSGGVKKTLWLWWSGNGRPDLFRCVRAYLHPFRHRARVQVPEGNSRMDDSFDLHARASRPLDVAHRRGLHPAPSRPRPRRRSPDAVGAPARPTAAHPGKGSQGVSATSLDDRHSRQSTEIHHPWARTPKRHPPTPAPALSRGQKGGLTRSPRFKCKLRPSGDREGSGSPCGWS